MILYRAANMAEAIGIPEYFVEELGQLQLCQQFLRMTWCSSQEVAGARMLIPRYDVVRPVAGMRSLLDDITRLVEDGAKAGRGLLTQHH